ncbi:hypothetical protein D3C72_1142050 [compost metagenome]
MRPVAAQRQLAVTPDRHDGETARPVEIQRHLQFDVFCIERFPRQWNVNPRLLPQDAGTRLYGHGFAVHFRHVHRTDPTRITDADSHKRLAQRDGFPFELVQLIRIKLRFQFQISAPDLPIVDADASGFDLLIAINHQRFRQQKVQETALVLNLNLIFNRVINFRYRNRD